MRERLLSYLVEQGDMTESQKEIVEDIMRKQGRDVYLCQLQCGEW